MLKRTALASARYEYAHLDQFTSKLKWKPEIRMLDKDEKLPELPMEQVIFENNFAITSYREGCMWPPMDPLNPTKEQRRTANTMQMRMPDRHVSPHHMGFRTIPPELIDWRTTSYGDGFQELPTMNEKMTYSFPDYTLAGLVYTAQEQKAISDSVAQTVEQSPFAALESPKHANWFKFHNFQKEKNHRNTATFFLGLLISSFIMYKVTQAGFRHQEVMYRRQVFWWDGANAGSWKFAGKRSYYFGQALTGGWVIPILEW
eukprot:TRINITY_DN12314_c5_g1_i1.p1 TRINITY_DN12314_c5_g1~~TRINITY_DN12314_c5_g1_i1.p1  ORF type:complete len:259 (+),score=23.20 TRINITY_DN12314_c5_g1_i1:40-816(+)